MKVAALQMTSGVQVVANLATAQRLLELAAVGQAQLAVLPENFAFMGKGERDKLAVAEDDGDGPIQAFIAAQARALALTVVAGTVPLRVAGDTRVAAASLVYGPDGRRLGRYDKIHLFDVDLPGRAETYRESAGTVPGTAVVVLDTPAGRVGLSVCYDLRFPELYRRMAAQGADFMVVPAAFTVPTGEAHWDVLLRARAIENLCHVVAAAQSGSHENGRRTHGNSLVVDCWGEVLGRLPDGEGCVLADIDLSRQRTLRAGFTALTHRVFD
ncbi:MAG: carbon-nitrogen hydrolase family protein [Pseudomonadota bacterium]